MSILRARTSHRRPKAKKPSPTTRRKSLPVAPPNYFTRFYTPELAAEDNHLAAHSAHG